MPVEIRHTERMALYHILLIINGYETLEEARSFLMATMESDDVKLVEKQMDDLLKSAPKKEK